MKRLLIAIVIAVPCATIVLGGMRVIQFLLETKNPLAIMFVFSPVVIVMVWLFNIFMEIKSREPESTDSWIRNFVAPEHYEEVLILNERFLRWRGDWNEVSYLWFKQGKSSEYGPVDNFNFMEKKNG